MCECVVEHRSNHSDNTEGKETDFQSVENLKKFDVTKCPLHANQECILKRINELETSKRLFSSRRQMMGCLVVRIFPRDRQKQS